MSRRAIALHLAIATTLGTAIVLAGPLSPPAGPVASTYKTLGEIEPRTAVNAANCPGDATATFRITQPGSYYLTGDIQGESGKSGIRVEVSGVTIDLSGFAMRGVAGSVTGIYLPTFNQSDATIRNGFITGWGSSGVYAGNSSRCTFEDLHVSANATSGINCFADCLITRCHATGGLIGFGAAVRARITDCTATDVSTSGIICGAWGVVSACTISGAGTNGIFADDSSSVTNCSISGCQSIGIHLANGGIVTGCTVATCQNDGIYIADGCSVSGCTLKSNLGSGIHAGGSDSLIAKNLCVYHNSAPGTPGILVSGTGNRIEDNQCNYARYGVKVDGANNIVVRNTCRGNSLGNFSVAAGNELGPVVTNPGSNGYATATMWSNFAY